MSAPTLKVLLVGGMMSHLELYAPSFRKDPRLQLVGVTAGPDASPERKELAAQAAAWLDAPHLPAADEPWLHDGVDVVCVTTPIETRAAVIASAAAAGKHLYLDKPLVGCEAELATVEEAIRAGGGHARVYTFAETDWVADALAAARGGTVGDVRGVHVDVLFAKGVPDLEKPRVRTEPDHRRYTFVDAKRELAEIGFYGISAAVLCTRRPVRSVRAVTGNFFFDAHRRHDVEDLAALLLDFGDGVVGTVLAGRYGTASHRGTGIHRIRLVGDAGTRSFDAWSTRLELNAAAASAPPGDPRDPMSMWPSTTPSGHRRDFYSAPMTTDDWADRDVRHFVDDILADRRSLLDGLHASHVTAVVLAAYRSSASGSPEAVPPIRRA